MAYDPTLKQIIDEHAPDWVRWLQGKLGLPVGPLTVESTNLSTQADADRVFRLELREPMLLDLEPESSWQNSRPERYLQYSVVASDKSGCPLPPSCYCSGR